MKCSNCPSEAVYVYEGSGVKDTPYCLTCLPSFAKPMVKAKTIRTTELYSRTKEEVLSRLAPPSEEVAETDKTGDEGEVPAPRRRRAKTKPVEAEPTEEQAED